MIPVFDPDVCIACGACEAGCPAGAIEVDDVATVNADDCIGCGACIDTCPVEAISEGEED